MADLKIFSPIFWGIFMLGLQPQVMATPDGPDCWKVDNVATTDTLSVRSGPSAKYQEITKFAHDTDGIQIINTAKQVGKSVWVPIMYGEIIGWVNRTYLAESTNCFETPNYHVVVEEDTLFSISQRYGYMVDKVAEWNHLQKPYKLQIGQRLQVSSLGLPVLPLGICSYHVIKVKNNDGLWMHAEAGSKSKKIGAIPYDGIGIRIVGAEVELKKSRWVPVKYKCIEGWVNRGYLEKDC